MTTIDDKTGDDTAENEAITAPIEAVRITFGMAEASGVTEAGLKAALTEKIGATHVEIEDMSGGCGQAFSAIIVSPEFAKKTTLARHRLVNTALKTEIAAIHAWTPKCYTPEQWLEQGPGTVAPGKATTGEVKDDYEAAAARLYQRQESLHNQY